MNCPSCNTPLRPGASFCSGCGNPVRREERCTECNAPLVPGDAFCSNCGAAIQTIHEPVASHSQRKSVPSGYDVQPRPLNLAPPRKGKSQYYSANVKCDVTEENRNTIKQVFLRSFMKDSDLVDDNGVFIILKKKDEGVFLISIDPLPGAQGYSIQIQADTTNVGVETFICILCFIGMVLSAGGSVLLPLLCIGVPLILFSIISLVILFSLENAIKKRLKLSLNQVVAFFNQQQ